MKTVTVEFTPSFYKKTDPERANKAARKAVDECLIRLEVDLKKEVPVRTGYLRDSHATQLKPGTSKIIGEVYNHAKYWRYVHFGTSKQAPNQWITRSLINVQPQIKLSEYFRRFYEGK